MVVVVVGAWWVYSNKGNLPGSGYQSPANYSPSPTPKKGKSSSKAPQQTPVSQSGSGDYTSLLQQYSGRTFQFDDLCHGTPGQMVVKKGQSILLDNRSANPITLRLDTQSYMLAGYGFKVVNVNPPNPLPYQLGVDCRSSVNGGTENGVTINVQALIYQ